MLRHWGLGKIGEIWNLDLPALKKSAEHSVFNQIKCEFVKVKTKLENSILRFSLIFNQFLSWLQLRISDLSILQSNFRPIFWSISCWIFSVFPIDFWSHVLIDISNNFFVGNFFQKYESEIFLYKFMATPFIRLLQSFTLKRCAFSRVPISL